MKIVKQYTVFDTADLDAESTFWAGVLGGEVSRREDDWHVVSVDGETRLAFQLAPNHVPPNWPVGEQQLHLDLYVDDVPAAHDEVIALGATVLQPAEDPDAESGFTVYADPSGHPFCICWG